jgi:hypothetical protein
VGVSNWDPDALDYRKIDDLHPKNQTGAASSGREMGNAYAGNASKCRGCGANSVKVLDVGD